MSDNKEAPAGVLREVGVADPRIDDDVELRSGEFYAVVVFDNEDEARKAGGLMFERVRISKEDVA